MRPSNFVDITDQRFGTLIAKEYRGYRPGAAVWECICDCGQTLIATSRNLRTGRTKSCGCKRIETIRAKVTRHGHARRGALTREFVSWRGMIERCTNRNSESWKDYGGRGITVCERWKVFENFFLDMGQKPSKRHSIDRINVNGNYEASNCRWATPIEQRHNRRDSKREQSTNHG